MIIRGVFTPLLWATIGAGAATMASAQDAKGEAKEQRIIIMNHKDGKLPDGLGDLRIKRGADGRIELAGCEGVKEAAKIDEKQDGKPIRVMICTKGSGSAAEQAASLEKAKERLAGNEHLSAETREKIRLQLETELARLRAAK